MQQIDVELALVDMSEELVEIQNRLPSDCYAEDQSDRGWGLVIRTSRKLSDDLSHAVDAFLEQLIPLAAVIRNHKGVLRVGIFYNTATCTFRLDSADKLSALNLSLEISTYPTSDDE